MSSLLGLPVVLFLTYILLCHSLPSVHINTSDGPVVGSRYPHHDIFFSIPYAQPPIGALRFRPPVPALSRSTTYNATYFRNECVQLSPLISASEDCLYLSVFVPHSVNRNKSDASVLFWIHGGSLTGGAGSDYDGQFLSNSSNTIIVTINYRLGAFGFLALNELRSLDGTTGNYGILDQRLAMRWTISNIKFFGGDPAKLTIAGESAGAFSVCTHLAAPRSQGLYRSAVLQSIYLDCNAFDWNTAVTQGANITKYLGCGNSTDVVKCIQKSDASAILNISSEFGWATVLDGSELTKQPFDYMANGERKAVPILLGTNKDESAFSLCGTPAENITQDGLRQYLVQSFGEAVAAQVLSLYNVPSYASPFLALVDMQSDYTFKCPTKLLAQFNQLQKSTWMYSFNHAPRGSCGAEHAFELPWLWPSMKFIIGSQYVFTKEETRLAEDMRAYWIRFVEHQNPNLLPIWNTFPKFDDSNQRYFNLQTEKLYAGDKFRSPYCEFWNSLQPTALSK